MRTKVFALSIAVLLFTSVAANSRECTKETGFWFEAGNGDMCLPYSVGQVGIGQANVYKAAGVVTAGVVCLKTHQHCGWQKYLK